MEKKESPKEGREVKPVISLSGKIGYEDWVFSCTKLTTNTKKQRLKIWSRDWIFKNTILKKRRRREKKKQTNKTNKKKTKTKKNKATRIIKKQHQPQKDYIQRLL